jgi:hypothetical protein
MTLSPAQIYGGISQLGASAKAQAVTPWWLAGGVSPANVVAAYQPKGAASLAASYINLANPGAFDAVPVAVPGWSAAAGWIFTSAQAVSTVPVISGESGAKIYTMIIQFTNSQNAFNRHLFGARTGAAATNVNVSQVNAASADLVNANRNVATSRRNNGSYAIAGFSMYADGVFLGDAPFATTTATTPALFVGASNDGAGGLFNPMTVNISAFAVYDTKLTAPQVAAISAAMSAL